MIYVIGHKNPDSDSTGSPLIWAWHLRTNRGLNAEARLLNVPNMEADFMLHRWGFDRPAIIERVGPGDDLVVVDTNNVGELPPGINDANVIEIIDHHRLQGGLTTRLPLTVTIRPLACTATIMHQLMGEDSSHMPSDIRGLMLTCILSDTLAFRSPTTTPVDRALAETLAAELGIEIDSYAAEMFAAKSNVEHLTDAELLRTDSKSYEVDGVILRVSVLETTCPEAILKRKAGLMDSMKAVADDDKVDDFLFFVVDILNEQSTLLIQNDFVRSLARKSFDVETDGDELLLPGVTSRKLQIVPRLAI